MRKQRQSLRLFDAKEKDNSDIEEEYDYEDDNDQAEFDLAAFRKTL